MASRSCGADLPEEESHNSLLDECTSECTHYLKLSDLPNDVTTDLLEVFLSAICEDVKKVTLLGGNTAVAEVTFTNGVPHIVEKTHRIKKQPVKIELCGPPEPQPEVIATSLPLPEENSYRDIIEVTCHDVDTDMLQIYFEGAKSGGKREKEVEFIKQISECVFHVKFESADDAAVVVEEKNHSVLKKTLQVCYAPLPPPPIPKQYDQRKLLITDIPSDIDKEHLTLFIEGRLSLEHGTDFTISLRSSAAILVFKQLYTDEELNAMIVKITKKQVKKKNLTVERCEINCSIIVSGISSKAFNNEEGLCFYFESPRSGGGEDVLDKVEMLGHGKAKVAFKDPSVMQRVKEKKHDKLGPSVTINECTVLDTFEITSLEMEEEEEVIEDNEKRDNTTGEKKTIKLEGKTDDKKKYEKSEGHESYNETDLSAPPLTDEPPVASQIPLNPILHPLDPLLAKYVRFNPDITKSIQQEFQVTIAIDDRLGTFTISPTNSSPPDWENKSISMTLEVFSNSLIKVDIPVSPEVSDTVYPMIMKACNEGGLQYAFGQGNSNKLTVAGDLDSVMKLQRDVEEFSSRLIKKQDEVHVKSEDYAYLNGYALSVIQREYPNIKLLCNDDHLTLSIEGSLKDVSSLQDKLSQYLSHASIPVNLHPLIVKFLRESPGKRILDKLVKKLVSKAIPFFTCDYNEQWTLQLLCSHDCIAELKTLVTEIQKEVTIRSDDLSKSFHKHVASSKFKSFQDELDKKYCFSATVCENQLFIVSLTKDIETVRKEFSSRITEACSENKSIHLKKGVWRLFHGSMEKKWTDLMSELRRKGVEIVSSSKPNVNKPYVQIKGEIENVEYAEKEILALQSSIKERQIPISRPGICQYLYVNPNGQMVLKGVETEANVCIEIGINEEESTLNSSQSASRGPHFEKLCFGTTAEKKIVSVYIGDITDFNKAEVIVNAANERLAHGAGVARSIADRGGPIIQQDSTSYFQKKGSLRIGDAVLFTNVGNLPSSYQAIVHAVGPTWNHGQDRKREIALLKRAVRKSLEAAQDYNSIAIPAISSGIYGFPVDVCANTLFEAVVEFSQQESTAHLNEIHFVIFPDNSNEFLKAGEKHLKSFQSINLQQWTPSPMMPITPVDDNSSRRRRRGTKQDLDITLNGIVTSQITKPSNFIKITKGSIIEHQGEALVNTTDTQLGFGGFVAQALAKAAGPGLQQECDAIAKPVAVGNVKVTGGHGLKSKHILHIVLPGYDGPNGNSEGVLRNVVRKCLAECTRLKVSTLSMPSIGAGNLKYPDNVVARALIEETSLYFERNHGQTMLKYVNFVIFDQSVYDEFQHVYQSPLAPTPTSQLSQTQPHSTTSQQQRQPSTPSQPKPSDDDNGSCTFSLPHGLKLEVVKGDISCDDSDVVVNTTQENLSLVGSGVSGALLKKGGQELQDACNEAVLAGHRATDGKVVATRATGQLKCRLIFHISLHHGKKPSKTILACLEKAEKSKYQSIAFPAIGTGVHGIPASEAAKDMVDALKKFTKGRGPKNIKVIRMIVFQKDIHDQFVSAFKSMGDSSGSFMSYFYSGVKTIGSFFTGSSMTGYHSDQSDEPMEIDIPFNNDDSDDEPDVSKMLDSLSLESEIILYIYGETDHIVARAEKRLRSIIDTQFTDEEIVDASIISLSDTTIKELKSFAKSHNVDIDIDRDPVLHSVKLHGCLQDVLLVKDKVRDAMSSYSVEQSQKAVADALFKTVRWMRMTSQETEEDYGEDLNYDIEQAYQSKKQVFDSTVDGLSINFAKMEERDKITHKIAVVRRVDFTQVKEDIPKDWDPMPMDSQGKEKHVQLVTLAAGSKEYTKVETAFNKTMKKGSNYTQIVRIQRLQNPALYKQYAVNKREMDKRNPKGHTNEQWLWHGTSFDTFDKISTQGFNRSFAGKNATAFGRGVYFARDSSYSSGYTSPDASGQRYMYYTQVLTGEYTVGNSSMVVPPPKNPQVDPNILFDATVNNASNPSIFVVYNDAQNYPAYVVSFK